MVRLPFDMAFEEGMYLFHHVFLPPKLPQKDDYKPEYERVLLDKFIDALHGFSRHVPSQDASILTTATTAVSRLRGIAGLRGDVNEEELKKTLAQLRSKGIYARKWLVVLISNQVIGGFFPIHIREQNAAVLLSRDEDAIRLETFELSPRNKSVMTTVGRLKRLFPGPTLALDLTTFDEPGLQNVIVQTLARMSHQPVADTKQKVWKAGQEHDEDRDTTHPKMVTEFFMAVLRPLCVESEATQIQKNTREEVLWHDCQSPWRRSALWLLMRVALQLIFRRLSGEERKDDLYKQFMAYFMSSIVDTISETMPSDNIYAMNAKIARRLLKLGLSKEPAWLKPVQHILRRSSDIIRNRWEKLLGQQSSHQAYMPALETLDFEQDIYCTLTGLDEYLKRIQKRGLGSPPMLNGDPARPNLQKHLATECPSHLDFADTEYRVYNLAAFEEWVSLNLAAWLEIHCEEENTCSRLGGLMTYYYEAASSSYSQNPEAISVMLLTLLELWIACDKSANSIHRTLHEYDPCIPADMFQSLLLPFQSQMVRLDRAERYLYQRQRNIQYSGSGIFKDFGTPGCFSVRYFDLSSDHQRLYRTIETRANQERTQRKMELQEKRRQCENLQRLAREMECRYDPIIDDDQFDYHHSPYCKRCQFISRANSIDISVHEWPLPTDFLQAKSVIFELDVPLPFGSWRETTIFFLLNVLNVEYATKDRPRAQYRLQTYQALFPFFIPVVRQQRIGLLSQNKPHEVTHRQRKLVNNATENDICLKNGLHFQYFDDAIGCFMDSFESTLDTANACTYRLSQQSSPLQQFLFRPAKEPNGPSPNTVIATQHAAPKSMTLEEYRSLATMPLGVRIQWQHILVELCTSSVDFKKAETVIFFLQIINQAGPPREDTHLREAHMVLGDQVFAIKILERVKEVSERIMENWELVQGLSCLIFLVLRVLSLSPFSYIHGLCLRCLRDLRKTAFVWVNLVREKANQTVNDTCKTGLVAKYVHIALACTETFNAENMFETFATPSDVSVFIQCCMMIHDWKNCLSMESDPVLPILYQRWQKLAYNSHRILSDYIVSQKNPGLDLAVEEVWAAYRPQSDWSMVGELDCWLMTRTAYPSGMLVHFNLLTGELLVNGIPLARLPSEYERHPTYQRLFGRSQLEVIPSDSPGMKFSCRKQYMGHTIHLGKERIHDTTDSDLMIRAVRGDQAWELIPPGLLMNLLPDAFVENYVHWYSVDDGYVEFRPASDPWLPSFHNWQLRREKGRSQTAWYLERQGTFLISICSQTAEVISRIFQPVEEPLKLHCSFHMTGSVLDIHLPRLQLGFSLRSQCSSIQSRQYPNMSVDPDQSLDSLVGLRNKLLLVHANTQGRVILISEGDISWERVNDHVNVKIEWQPETKLHAYSIDCELGRLVDNGSLQSKLLLSYLHAVSSFCLPDPLTKKTGTEQALSIIRSAAVRSFDRLLPEHTEILAKIAELTPERRYYPENERVMQKIYWKDNTSFLSHHNDFYMEIRAIFDQDRRMRFFHPGTEIGYPSLPHVEEGLLKRDQIRASSIRISGFGAEYHTQEYDCCYDALDRIRETVQGDEIFRLCKMIYMKVPCVWHIKSVDLTNFIWRFLSRYRSIHGPDAPIDTAGIGYDAEWILGSGKFIASYWCSLNRLLCSSNPPFSKFQLMTWLSTMAFSRDADFVALEIIAAFFVIPEMILVRPPTCKSFLPGEGYEINSQVLRTEIWSTCLSQTPEQNLRPEIHENHEQFKRRKKRTLKDNRDLVLQKIILDLVDQWPTRVPWYNISQENPKFDDYFHVQRAKDRVKMKFTIWHNNRELWLYLSHLATVLGVQQTQTIDFSPPQHYNIPEYTKPAQQRRGFVCVDELLCLPPSLDIPCPELPKLTHTSPLDYSAAPSSSALMEKLHLHAKSSYEEWYIKQLQGSAKSLQDTRKGAHVRLDTSKIIKDHILDYLSLCQEYASECYLAIMSQMSVSTEMAASVFTTLESVSQWPRLSPALLLEQLSRHRWHRLLPNWKRCIITWGCSITTLQWAKRLARLTQNPDELLRELQNPGHIAWDPFEFPESLILEIENGILIRDIQEGIAKQMRTFEGPNENAVMQLNMGEGKSSVIVPIVAMALANQSCLVRVLVAKPQSRQMFQMLVSKLGGLLGRRVYHMPISRAIQFGEAEADEVDRICRECISQGGVLLIQPEQVLSLKLKCLECFIVGKHAAGHSLLKTLHFFQTCSRDVVDESDENFNVKLELIYTMGVQRPVELSPQRWILIQRLLDLVRRYAPDVRRRFPRLIEVEEQQLARFPKIRLLHDDAKNLLFRHIAKHISDNGIEYLPISRQRERVREAVLTYVIKPDLTADEIAAVEDHSPAGFWTESTKAPLLLLRGMLAGGVLAFCLGQKRWRVNYGPDPSRDPPTKLCVPYRAKDNPSPRSEFSHPDVVITLTSLNYYYAGLDDEDLFLSLNHLTKSDQADTEYQAWVNDAPGLPHAYRQLVGINIDDRQYCTERIFPTLRFSKAAIDYFLCQIVFPREMKEFPDKLSASGWDIGEIKTNPTVGFSGTNDSRKTLPLGVRQLDLPEQNHTNALVLEYLLQPENSVVFITDKDDPSKSDAQVLLDLVLNLDPAVQVILDVGAQILELSNFEVAKRWLEMLPKEGSTQAVVFVNDIDDICVLDRNGRVEPLQISPFARQMDACFVFLDEAHTRGIDLKLPANYRAAVTLGPGITKDKLVQGKNNPKTFSNPGSKPKLTILIACMRMRKLGSGQSVIFCIPREVKFNILALNRKENESDIDVSDVLCWAVSETWTEIRRSIPLWAVQGRRFEHQQELWHDSSQRGSPGMTPSQAENFLEPECQTLEKRYQPIRNESQLTVESASSDNKNLRLISDRCHEFGNLDLKSSTLQEEQERELATEIECERQVQRPPEATPEEHYVHPHLHSFVATGRLKKPSDAYIPAFQALENTSAASFLDLSQFPTDLLVTEDFATTITAVKVLNGSGFIGDAFQRPVRWILTSVYRNSSSRQGDVTHMMVISPYEANFLLPEIKKSRFVRLHLYTPRQNQGFSPLDKLTLYNVPGGTSAIEIPYNLRILLNLFAGQLYLESYSGYRRLCDFLGVAFVKTSDDLAVAADGFILHGNEESKTTFRQSPLKFLNVLASQIRKDCQDIEKTHIGQIVNGRLLSPSDFEPYQQIPQNLQ